MEPDSVGTQDVGTCREEHTLPEVALRSLGGRVAGTHEALEGPGSCQGKGVRLVSLGPSP